MSELSFEDYEKSVQSTPYSSSEYAAMNGNRPQVGFFTLKNDGEEAIVRILYDSVADIKVVNTHAVNVPTSKYPKRVNCLTGDKGDISKCPFCANSFNIQKKIYVKILQYTKNADGTVNTEAKVWERPAKFGFKLRDIMNNYGPLSDQICKIVRHGVSGSTDTEYQVLPNLSKQVFPDNLFPKKIELFENYNAVGRVVLNKTFEEAQHYIANGDFPAKPNSNQTNNVNTVPVAQNSAQTWTAPATSNVSTFNPATVDNSAAQQFTPPTPSTTNGWDRDDSLPF